LSQKTILIYDIP